MRNERYKIFTNALGILALSVTVYSGIVYYKNNRIDTTKKEIGIADIHRNLDKIPWDKLKDGGKVYSDPKEFFEAVRRGESATMNSVEYILVDYYSEDRPGVILVDKKKVLEDNINNNY